MLWGLDVEMRPEKDADLDHVWFRFVWFYMAALTMSQSLLSGPKKTADVGVISFPFLKYAFLFPYSNDEALTIIFFVF